MAGPGHGEKLTRKKEQAIAALLCHPSIPEAAKVVGIGERTLWRWLKQEGFSEAYQEARREVVRHAMAQIHSAMTEAVQTLRDVMADTEATSSARVSAAKAVMDLGLKAAEVEDLEARVAKLEKNLPRSR